MNFIGAVQQAWKIILLDRKAIKEASKDKNGLANSIMILIISGLALAIEKISAADIIAGPLSEIVSAFMMVGIIHFFALMFGG